MCSIKLHKTHLEAPASESSFYFTYFPICTVSTKHKSFSCLKQFLITFLPFASRKFVELLALCNGIFLWSFSLRWWPEVNQMRSSKMHRMKSRCKLQIAHNVQTFDMFSHLKGWDSFLPIRNIRKMLHTKLFENSHANRIYSHLNWMFSERIQHQNL